MILYFADRNMRILGSAGTGLRRGIRIEADRLTEDVETGVSVFECCIPFDKTTRQEVEAFTEAGNYLLRSHDSSTGFYTITETELDSKKQEVWLYAEDAGLDLLNDVAGPFAADEAHEIDYYIDLFAYDSGFTIGINEAAGITRKLSWEGEATATERLASVATQFGGFEISYGYEITGLQVVQKRIHIYRRRGQDNGVQLRLNREIDRIITKKSIVNLATALECTGRIPEGGEEPITLEGYVYDDGDFYVEGTCLYSREALKKWRRYDWSREPNRLRDGGGHLTGRYSYDTPVQQTLCAHAITRLKKLREVEVIYEVEISCLPEGVGIGDQVSIIDEQGEMYLSARILQLEVSVDGQRKKAVLSVSGWEM